MAAISYDIVIFGASGFTGKYVVREALKFLASPNSPLKSLALAGRSSTKLSQTLKWASTSHPTIPILVADTSDPSSLRRMASQAKLLLNCVGPFRLYGDPVVSACVEVGCDYLDICGEPEFMERMEAAYHEKAMENGSLVISACGFDSVPAELGWMFNSMQWDSPAVPNRIEAYVSLESNKRIVGNFATFESAVLGVANAGKLTKFRRSRRRARPLIPGPRPAPVGGSTIEHQKEIGLWAVKLPAADPVVVKRTLSILTDNPSGLEGVNEDPKQAEKRAAYWSAIKPAHFGVKIGSNSLEGVQRYIQVGTTIGLLASSYLGLGRWLLLNFPSIFTHGLFRKSGPTEDQVDSATFKMWFVGQGFSDANHGTSKPDTEIITRIMGPEIGYLTTPIILVQCALILLKQRGDLPKGGVFPPGVIFGPTDLQDRLQENGISFDVISKRNISA